MQDFRSPEPDAVAFPRFPIGLFTIVLGVTAGVLILLAVWIYDAYRFARDDLQTLSRLETLRGTIVHLDEVLTMSARMAAATGDPAWEKRYDLFDPPLDAAIKEAIRLSSSLNSVDAVKTDAANVKLVKMERQAFARVREGKPREAMEILFGPEYEAQKRIYAEGMSLLNARLREQVETRVADERRWTFLGVVSAALLMPLLLVTWVGGVRRIRTWQGSVVDLSRRLMERTRELAELTRALDQRVEERTEHLRQSEERFRQLAENIREVFWITDPEATSVLYVSPAYEEIWGRTCAALVQDPRAWIDAVVPEHLEQVENLSRRAASGETAIVEYMIVRPDGAHRWIRDRAFPIRDASGRVYRLAGVAEDITESRKSEESQRQSQKMQAIGRLAGGIAHDFNNLLTAILGYAQMLQKRFPEGDPGRGEIEEITRAGERAAGLTRQLLVFGRKQVIQPRKLDLNTVLGEMDKMLRRLIGEDIQFSTVLRPGLWTVRGDSSQIQQIMMNLVLNARDAMPSRGVLTVETMNVTLDGAMAAGHGLTVGDYVMIAVSDTGSGITQEVRARLFEPFFTTKEVGKGTGLGLSTVYGIVTQGHGQISVYTEVGRGSTFKVYMPRLVEEAEAAVVPPPAASATALRGQERILVVEDEEMVRALILDILAEQGYRVTTARNGVEAFSLFSKGSDGLDLVITDVVMPQMSGIELSRRLAEISPGLRVLFMSGYPDGAMVQQGELSEDTPYLHKPFSPTALLQKIRETLDGPEPVKLTGSAGTAPPDRG